MNKKEAIEIINILQKTYPDAKCSLTFNTPFELLVSVILSAQCTDERVNKVTSSIYKKYNIPCDFASMDINKLEELIKPCGFHKTKAKHIKECSNILIKKYNSVVPNTMEELISLPGVGRKTANCVLLEAFNDPQGIAIDTHAKRISKRLGLTKNDDPLKIEQDLMKIFPKELYAKINHLFMWLGRDICKAPSPNCKICPVQNYCSYYKKISK